MKFEKSKIIEILKENEKSYMEAYEKLFKLQKRKQIVQIERNHKARAKSLELEKTQQIENLNAIRLGETATNYTHAITACQKQTYADAINMFELAHGDVVNLSLQEYLLYVADKWGWRQNFDMQIEQANNRDDDDEYDD